LFALVVHIKKGQSSETESSLRCKSSGARNEIQNYDEVKTDILKLRTKCSLQAKMSTASSVENSSEMCRVYKMLH
jgi:hypothetical protein